MSEIGIVGSCRQTRVSESDQASAMRISHSNILTGIAVLATTVFSAPQGGTRYTLSANLGGSYGVPLVGKSGTSIGDWHYARENMLGADAGVGVMFQVGDHPFTFEANFDYSAKDLDLTLLRGSLLYGARLQLPLDLELRTAAGFGLVGSVSDETRSGTATAIALFGKLGVYLPFNGQRLGIRTDYAFNPTPIGINHEADNATSIHDFGLKLEWSLPL